MTTFDYDSIEIKEFVPKKRSAEDCLCKNLLVIMDGERIKYTKCHDCKNEVWS